MGLGMNLNKYLWVVVTATLFYSRISQAAQSSSKRHLTNNSVLHPIQSALNRRTRSPTSCRSTCSKMKTECSRTCYPPPGSWSFYRNEVDEKYQCFEDCINPESQIYQIPSTCVPLQNVGGVAPRMLGSNELVPSLDAAHLTTRERCKLDGYVDSWVCEFETKNPVEAEKVFTYNRKQLSLCDGGTVYSGDSGLYMYGAEDDMTSQNGFNVRTKKSVLESQPKPRGERIAMHRREKRQTNRKTLKHICPTNTKLESPGHAIHKDTGEKVSLFFHDGYSQWFEVGTCASSRPIIPIDPENRFGKIECGQAFTLHRAMFFINIAKVRSVKRYKNCNNIPNEPGFKLCHDWVYLRSHCKLFIE